MGVRRQERRKGTGAVTEVSVAVTIETGISRVMRGMLSPRKAVSSTQPSSFRDTTLPPPSPRAAQPTPPLAQALGCTDVS